MEKPWMVEGKFIELTADQQKELETDQLAQYTSDKNKASIEASEKKFEDQIEQAMKKGVSLEDYNTFKEEMQNTLEALKLSEKDKTDLHQKHADLIAILKDQGIKIASLRSSNEGLGDSEKREFSSLSKREQFAFLLKKGMETDEYKNWFNSDNKGATQKMDVSKVTGLGSDHTGPIYVTEPVNNVRDIPRMQPHMRDYLSVGSTDETDITFPEVDNYADIYTLGAQMLDENEEITDVSFNSHEETSKVTRMGVSMNVSKRYFRGRSKVIIDHVLAQIPDAMLFKEDVQILQGDGSGNNLSGIIADARKFNLTPNTFTAGQIASVASYNGGTQTLVTFTVPHKMLSGDSLTIAGATEASYNEKHEETLLIDETKIVINLDYVAEATATWTATAFSYWYQLKEGANEFDVLSAAASVLAAGLYNANAVFLNDQTVMNIGTLKATDLQYIGVTRDAAGNLNLSGIPIISIPVIPAGWFLIGDFSQKNIEIREYTPMSIQFLEDITTKKQNSIVILADEEIHLVKYNPKWYIYDRFSTSKAQIEKPA